MVRIIPEHDYSQREITVINILKDVNINLNMFINVGFHDWDDARRHWWTKFCESNNIDWKIIEIFEPNIVDAIDKGCPEDKIFELDINDVDNIPDGDCLFFWHGPEHVEKETFLATLKRLENKYPLLIFGMPIGDQPQDDAYGNPWEIHVSAWETLEWEQLGYTVIEVHDGHEYSHITVFKINNIT